MNINERLQEIKRCAKLAGIFNYDLEWMHDTINQLQKKNERLENLVKMSANVIIENSENEKPITDIDEATYDKTQMAYYMMKDLLIEMNGFGDLESYDTSDIFKLIGELEQVRLAKINAGVDPDA